MGGERLAEAGSWAELQDLLFADSWNPDLRRFRSPYAFRGITDAERPLATTLARLGGDFAAMEGHLLRNFRKYAHRDAALGDSLWHWLALAQHHGLPSRLLDWTYSPLVALHFATYDLDRMDRDGAVWAVNYHEAHRDLPEKLRAELEHEGSDVFTTDMLGRTIASLGELEGFADEPFLVFFEPPAIDERIVNQYALTSMLSSATATVDGWLERRPRLARKIVVPAALKWEVRDKLDQANITERLLFPGLDGLSRWLRRNYSTRASEGGSP